MKKLLLVLLLFSGCSAHRIPNSNAGEIVLKHDGGGGHPPVDPQCPGMPCGASR